MDNFPPVIIPAYRPTQKLVELVRNLKSLQPNQRIIIIDDGSGNEQQPIFDEIKKNFSVEILKHSRNLGKGSALKTGFKHWLATRHAEERGVVTADADGQHLPPDIIMLGKALNHEEKCLHLGVRTFSDHTIPLRSRFGNKMTRLTLQLFTKKQINDTQTGLRAIPLTLVKSMMKSNAKGYEFELEMLLRAEKNMCIRQIAIQTVYIDHNASSHFRPLWDSLKIYFVFLRFAAVSLISAGIDFLCFTTLYLITKNVLISFIIGRIISSTINFKLNYQIAFKSNALRFSAALRYGLLVIFLSSIVYGLITFIHHLGLNVIASKILAEFTFFLISFFLQKFFIFTKAKPPFS